MLETLPWAALRSPKSLTFSGLNKNPLGLSVEQLDISIDPSSRVSVFAMHETSHLPQEPWLPWLPGISTYSE